MKRKLLILSVLVICAAILTGGTLAYFTSEGRAHNVITSGNVDIELREWADEEKETPFEDVSGVMPGTAVTNIVEIANTGVGDAWVRAKVEILVMNADGEFLPAEDYADLVTLDIDEDHWTAEGGYYYYNDVLAAGETTVPLFGHVTLDAAMGNRYQGTKIVVNVSAQAVQSVHNGETVLEAAGWPAEPQQ